VVQLKEVSHTKRHHINTGNYEWVELTTTVTVTGTENEADEILMEMARILVDEHLAPDISLALASSSEADSYAALFLADQEEQEPPRRRRRKLQRLYK
jgi:hypothetical protein